jgi:hypothetical protein
MSEAHSLLQCQKCGTHHMLDRSRGMPAPAYPHQNSLSPLWQRGFFWSSNQDMTKLNNCRYRISDLFCTVRLIWRKVTNVTSFAFRYYMCWDVFSETDCEVWNHQKTPMSNHNSQGVKLFVASMCLADLSDAVQCVLCFWFCCYLTQGDINEPFRLKITSSIMSEIVQLSITTKIAKAALHISNNPNICFID